MSQERRGGAKVATADAPLLEVRGLAKSFPVRAGALQRTVGHVRASTASISKCAQARRSAW